MKPFLALLGIAILTSSLEGAVAEGENLLINGGFDAEEVDFPEFWSPSSTKSVIYSRVGGPGGKKPSIVLKSDGATAGTVSLRQQGMTLVAGETYKLYGLLPEKREAYECLAISGENLISAHVAPLAEDGQFHISLAGLPCGDHSLKAVIRHRETQETILEAAYAITIVDIPTIDRSNIRQLNNLVAQLLNQSVGNSATPQSFNFVNPRDGWVFVALATDGPAPDLAVKIDDRDTVITAATDRLEAFRELPMGTHHIAVSGNNADARLLVRSIPEIFNYPPCANSHVPENGSYGFDEHLSFLENPLDNKE